MQNWKGLCQSSASPAPLVLVTKKKPKGLRSQPVARLWVSWPLVSDLYGSGPQMLPTSLLQFIFLGPQKAPIYKRLKTDPDPRHPLVAFHLTQVETRGPRCSFQAHRIWPHYLWLWLPSHRGSHTAAATPASLLLRRPSALSCQIHSGSLRLLLPLEYSLLIIYIISFTTLRSLLNHHLSERPSRTTLFKLAVLPQPSHHFPDP